MLFKLYNRFTEGKMYPATLPVSEEQYFYTEQGVFQNEYDTVRGYHGINYEKGIF